MNKKYKKWCSSSLCALLISSSPLAYSKIDLKNEGTICQVMSKYGEYAAHEKIANVDFSKNDSYTMLIYGMSKTDDFNNLSEHERNVFASVLKDVYDFVYDSNEITESNVKELSYQHCLKRTDKAWEHIISRAVHCQAKGRTYELATMLREKGGDIADTRSLILSDIIDSNQKEIMSNAIEFAYSNSNTASTNGKIAYDSCLSEGR